jgi:L-alanine-DL-glutamate epimerase-like enolase superfamily enzyme
MQIVAVRARLLAAPIDDVIHMSFSSLNRRQMVLVEVEGDDGQVGVGESWINYPPWAGRERLATLEEGIAPLVVGREVEDVELIWDDVSCALEPLGRQSGAPGPIMQALSGVDTALWDLLGKLRNTSVAELLGGRIRSSVPGYASGLGPNDVEAQIRDSLERGFTAVKVKLGFDREVDLDNIRLARRLVESGEVYADANQAWPMPAVVEMAKRLAAEGVQWLEEPVAGNRLEDLTELSGHVDLSLATGENLYGPAEFERYARSGAVSILQPDVAKSGGITPLIRVCQLASEVGVRVIPHSFGGPIGVVATLQVASALERIEQVELDARENPLWALLAEPLRLDAGQVDVPLGDGLGIELDGDAVRAIEKASWSSSTVTAV